MRCRHAGSSGWRSWCKRPSPPCTNTTKQRPFTKLTPFYNVKSPTNSTVIKKPWLHLAVCGLALRVLLATLHSAAAGYAEWQMEVVEGVRNGRLAQLPPDDRQLETTEADEWAAKAANLIPQRTYRGPGISIGSLAQLSQAERDEWMAFTSKRGSVAWTLPPLAEYWADGRRTALQIADLIEMETGIRDIELVVRYFELLQKLGLVTL